MEQYLENQSKFNHEIELIILIKTPKEEKLLQIVDFASWSYFRKIEHGDDGYYNIIKSKFVEESGLFP